MWSKIIVTGDNSKTLLIPELNETYHSTRGAFTEAQHVFIKEGLHFSDQKDLDILEMGFGTGLNALLTLHETSDRQLNIRYHTVESNPLKEEIIESMDYTNTLGLPDLKSALKKMHSSSHKEKITLTDHFSFIKYINKIEDQDFQVDHFDIIYYDAFGPKVQPELWDVPILEKMHAILKPKGCLVTYCAQGQFKRNLKSIGFEVQSIPGPPGKREMTRAIKR